MANFPSSLPVFSGFTSSHTLSADNHAAQSNLEQAEIVNIATKIGTGSSTPTNNKVLRGNGTGTSIWGQVDLTTDVTGVLPTANGGTGTNSTTGSGANVFASNASLSSPSISSGFTATGGAIMSGGGSWSGSPTFTTPVIADFSNSNHTHSNSAGGGKLNGGNAISAATIPAAQLLNGIVKNRQGGSSGDATWASAGTTNTDTSAKDVLVQVGTAAINANPTTITFPTAFNQVPIVLATQISPAAANVTIQITTIGTSSVAIRTTKDDGTNVTSEFVSWIAVGQ